MPSVAEKLCHDIVEPTIKRSTNANRGKSTSKFSKSPTVSNRNSQSPQFIHIDREKTSSKTKTLHKDGITIPKSKISIPRCLVESAVNTFISGPLRCDNNCVTLVRKRDHHSSCKCGQNRPNTKASTKCIQTLRKDFSRTDKACIHCVETATCGTQFLDKKNSILGNKKAVESKSNIVLKLHGARLKPCIGRHSNIIKDSCHHHFDNMNSKAPSLRFVTATRWALSNYPTRGPDF